MEFKPVSRSHAVEELPVFEKNFTPQSKVCWKGSVLRHIDELAAEALEERDICKMRAAIRKIRVVCGSMGEQ